MDQRNRADRVFLALLAFVVLSWFVSRWMTDGENNPRPAPSEPMETLAGQRGIVSGKVMTVDTTGKTDEELSRMEFPKQIRRFQFDPGNSVGPQTIDALRVHGDIDEVVFGPGVTDEALDAASSLVALKSIVVVEASASCTNAGLKNIGRLSNLRSLWITGYSMDDGAFANVGGCQNLELIATRARLSDKSAVVLSSLKHLRDLSVLNAEFTSAGLLALAKLTSLELLRMAACEAEDDIVVKTFLGMPNLRVLEMKAYGISDSGAARLVGHPSLEKLCLWTPSLGEKTLDALKAATSLKHFSSYMPFFAANRQALAAARADLVFVPYDGQ